MRCVRASGEYKVPGTMGIGELKWASSKQFEEAPNHECTRTYDVHTQQGPVVAAAFSNCNKIKTAVKTQRAMQPAHCTLHTRRNRGFSPSWSVGAKSFCTSPCVRGEQQRAITNEQQQQCFAPCCRVCQVKRCSSSEMYQASQGDDVIQAAAELVKQITSITVHIYGIYKDKQETRELCTAVCTSIAVVPAGLS